MEHTPKTSHAGAAGLRRRRSLLLLAACVYATFIGHTSAQAERVSGTGTSVVTNFVVTSSRVSGGNTIVPLEVTATLSGILEGTSHATETAIIHPDGTTNIQACETFTGSANGVAGVLEFRSVGVIDAAGALDGHFTIVSGSQGLEQLRGQGTLETVDGKGVYQVQLLFTP